MDLNSGGTSAEGVSKLDSHADTTAAEDTMVMLTNPEEVMLFVDVSPFSEDYAPMNEDSHCYLCYCLDEL